MGLSYDFPFNIADVCSLLNLHVRRRLSNSIYVDCPFCNNGQKGKLNINLAKNLYRCNYNEAHAGGMLELYAQYQNISRSDAYREICDALRTEQQGVGRCKALPSVSPQTRDISEIADLETRHQTYSMMLSGLVLSDSHKRNLMERGLTEVQIQQHGYKSTPAFGYSQLAARLMKQGCTLLGVPGFYADAQGEWTVSFNPRSSGIVIPVKSIDGRVQGAQIRLDRPIDSTKYFWLSSAEKSMGSSSGSPVHFVGDPQSKSVFVTEGGLKGTIAHELSGRSFLCNAGVNQTQNLRQALIILKSLGLKKVYECNDMDKDMDLICYCDYKEKTCASCKHRECFNTTTICPKKQVKRDNIRRGCSALMVLCAELELEAERLTWDKRPDGLWAGKFKGIDDFELHKKQRKAQMEQSDSE